MNDHDVTRSWVGGEGDVSTDVFYWQTLLFIVILFLSVRVQIDVTWGVSCLLPHALSEIKPSEKFTMPYTTASLCLVWFGLDGKAQSPEKPCPHQPVVNKEGLHRIRTHSCRTRTWIQSHSRSYPLHYRRDPCFRRYYTCMLSTDYGRKHYNHTLGNFRHFFILCF